MYINISESLELISCYFAENQESKSPQNLYDPRNYVMSMHGKKFRALYTLMGYGLFDESIAEALPLAYTVELFHNFTLVHDDIMDDADLRRGQQAVHLKYGEPMAILSGDVMLVEVYDRLAQMEDGLSYVRLFNKMAREVCEGQAMDMDFEARADVTIEEYLKMIELKTAVLLGLSLRVGARRAGASEQDQNHLYHFGVYAGIGFQLQDDYLDVYGDPEKFGKKVGGDIIQGKKTYLYLRALSLLGESEGLEFAKLYADAVMTPAEKVSRVRAQFDELHIPHYCHEAKRSFFELAVSHLNATAIEPQKRDDLIQFSHQLLDREK